MKQISLAQALKLKNRVKGDISRLQRLFQRENSRRSDSTSKVNAESVFNQLNQQVINLVILKAKIATANAPIYGLIEEIAQKKALSAFLKAVPCREGEERVAVGYSAAIETYNWAAFLNQEKIDELTLGIENSIAQLQDSLDAFNAGKTIEIEDGQPAPESKVAAPQGAALEESPSQG